MAITIGTNNPDTCGAYQLVRINPGHFIAKASPLSLTISAWSYAKDVTGEIQKLCIMYWSSSLLTKCFLLTPLHRWHGFKLRSKVNLFRASALQLTSIFWLGQVTVEMGFSDGSRIEDMVLEFNPAINRNWQHRCMVAHIDAHSKDSHQALHTHPRVPQQQGHLGHRSAELQWISVFAIFRTPHSGTVYFDDISVFPTTGIQSPIKRFLV